MERAYLKKVALIPKEMAWARIDILPSARKLKVVAADEDGGNG